MKLRLEEKILDMDDVPIKDIKEKEMILQDVLVNALMTPMEDDKSLSGDQKMALFVLAMEIKKGKEDVSVEDVSLIKKRIGKLYSQLIVGRAFALIEE